jgi:hypothetical protein
MVAIALREALNTHTHTLSLSLSLSLWVLGFRVLDDDG